MLLLVLGLAHLREWIAPGYKRNGSASRPAEKFAAALFEEASYQVLLQLANHAKHQRREALPQTQTTKFPALWDDRDTPIDSWMSVDNGPASAYEYGDQDLVSIFEDVMRFYQERWFQLPIEQRLDDLGAGGP